MEKEQFKSLTSDQQFSVINLYLNMVKDAIYARMGLLPFISALFATFLTIATFNEKIIALDDSIRFILSILIIFIPFSLYIYNSDLKKSVQKSRKFLEDLLGKIEVVSTFRDKVSSYLPDILIYIFSAISLVIVYKIWS